MATTRIHNPVTGTYYRIRTRDTSSGNKGSIIGRWSPPPSSKGSRKRK